MRESIQPVPTSFGRKSSQLWKASVTLYDDLRRHFSLCASMLPTLTSQQLKFIGIYRWFGERLQIGWLHLTLWSDEPTLSSLLDQDNNHYTRRLGEYWISGHPPLVSWIAFAIQEWGSWFYILEAMIDRASGGKLTEHAMSFRILANCCLWKVASCASPVDIPLQVVNWIFVRVMCAWGCNSSIHQLTNASGHFDRGMTRRLLRYHRYIRKDAIVWFTS